MDGSSLVETPGILDVSENALSLATAFDPKPEIDINGYTTPGYTPSTPSLMRNGSSKENVQPDPAIRSNEPPEKSISSSERVDPFENGYIANPGPELDGHLPPSNLKRESSQSSEHQSQVSRAGTEGHDTSNGSITSTSLLSPLPRAKSSVRATPLKTVSSITPETNPDYSQARPRSSIPTKLPADVYAQQCIAAAYASRLNPYALHKGEQAALQDHLCHLHVTAYLNIRNGILRLWTRNTMLSVTKDEALGCAKDFRWMNLASFAYDWLVRSGYINFGCVNVPKSLVPNRRGRRKEGPTIVIVGAGMAGLGCARQLEALFQQYRDGSQTPPNIIVLEGRRRIGGRIYSHPLRSLESRSLQPGQRSTAEMGAQIIVGFDHGNPLDPIIRGQLALRYHLLRDISTIYDVDGSPVDEVRDSMAEKLYNDILDRSGLYRHKAVINPTAEGDRELMEFGRDSSADDGLTIRQYEDAAASGTIGLLLPTKRVRRGAAHKTAEIKNPTTGPLEDLGPAKHHPAALACQAMGWNLRPGVKTSDSLSLDQLAASKTQTLGAVMDAAVEQYQHLLPMTAKDMRLVNWHFANLEYANAANVGKLSLSGWDQDMGNEFEGEHAVVVGGYQQVPRGLWSFPSKLDVRTGKGVAKISYDASGSHNKKATIHCEDGDTIVADKVVLTAPLGVLKKESINFEPPLPDWKTGPIGRLGFGILNKVILVFDKPFWDVERDMFGLLREPKTKDSMSQEDYSSGRGRFYLFWNCIKTSGLPMLIALMAGDAAHQAETTSDGEILTEVTSQLRNVFKDVEVPDPLETIITRWGQDKFAGGSYSFVGSNALPGDYDLMAKPIGNLFFAGEATCGTHPATVHGAYLSGLRAASEVLESLIGPIELQSPLVPPRNKNDAHINHVHDQTHTNGMNATPTLTKAKKRKLATTLAPPPAPAVASSSSTKSNPSPTTPSSATTATTQNPRATTNNSFPTDTTLRESYDAALWTAIIAELGPAKPRPPKPGLNPFLLYQKDYWHICKQKCDEAAVRKAKPKSKATAKAPRDEIRQALGQMWRDAEEEIRRPYLDQTARNRTEGDEAFRKWKEEYDVWERRTYEVKDRWCRDNPWEEFKAKVLAQGLGDVVAAAATGDQPVANANAKSTSSADATVGATTAASTVAVEGESSKAGARKARRVS
ncbi:hypothetical protein FQN54_000441 [Arachnomyces sp. PD_36]|nr:hypothetical protein FQN54_000441 [Arachnomyces sp. PD_36]